MKASAMTAREDKPLITGMALYKTALPTFLVGTYLLLRMFYFLDFEAQIADIILAASAPFLLTSGAVRDQYAKCRWISLLFALMIAENFVWFSILNDPSIGYSLLYYIYNFVVFIVIYSAREEMPSQFDKFVPRAIIFALFIQIIFMYVGLFVPDGLYRNTGTFTNPNQLAYWALCLLSIVLLIRPKDYVVPIAAIILAGYLIVASVSRGALMGYISLIILFFFHRVPNIHARVFAGLFICTASLFFFSADMFDGVKEKYELAQKLDTRANQRSAVDELEIRNYTRLTQDSQYLLLGAGEGGFYRFTGERYKYGDFANIEIHSTILTVLFCYGIVGLVLFLGIIIHCFRKSLWHSAYLVGIMVYGLSHNGLRFSIFWVFLAILISLISKPVGGSASERRSPVSKAKILPR